MAKLFETAVDLKKNEIQNARIENRTDTPSGAVTGQLWYRSDDITSEVTGRLMLQTTSGEKKIAVIEDIETNVGRYVPLTQKGVANGVATLDNNGIIPNTQLPSFVDDVLEFSTLSNFPTTGETGKIYVAQNTNKAYRWSGSAYVEIAQGIALGTGTPQDVKASATAGTSGAAAPFDHVHKIGSRVITSSNIAQNAITNYELASNAVNTVNINNAQVTGAKIASNTVANSNLSNMPAKTLKGNDTTSSATPKDLTFNDVAKLLINENISLPSVSAFANPALSPSGGVCTWNITGALTSARKRLGYHVPTVEIFDVSTATTITPVEMDVNINNSTGAITIYFNSSASVAANKYVAKITE